MKSVSLYFKEGSSDKVYNVALQKEGDGYKVNFSYGRRGAALSVGTKTNTPVDEPSAIKIFDKLVKEKKSKGYQEENNVSSTQISTVDKVDSGIRCQLLNDITEEQVMELLSDDRYLMEEKHDGRRLEIQCLAGKIIGVNKKGFEIALAGHYQSLLELGQNFIIDTEDMGDYAVAFDCLSRDGFSFHALPLYPNRKNELSDLLNKHLLKTGYIRRTISYLTTEQKKKAFEELKLANAEGVVFKLKDAPVTPGRPASGGSQLKYKFYATASFVVSNINTQRSVGISLFKDGALVPAGNVTIPVNKEIPAVNDVVEVRYLYAYKTSGSVFQPVYLDKRYDVDKEECTVDQLKYKRDND